jgi:hypothetical protein
MHDDMNAKPCDNCNMIIVNNVDLWLVHSQVASQLKDAKLEHKELKACSLLLSACTSYPLLRSAVEIKDFKHKLAHCSHYSVLSPITPHVTANLITIIKALIMLYMS